MADNFLGLTRVARGPWQALERALLRFFTHSGFSDCRLVGGSGDLGADVLATQGDKLWVVQVKFREQPYPIGDAAIEEAVRAATSYGADTIAVATNQSFGADSIAKANRLSSQLGIPVKLWPGDILLKWGEQLPSAPSNFMELREYQQTAVDAVERARMAGARRAMIVMATGLGKSRVASELIGRELARGPEYQALVVADKVELVHQLERESWNVLPKTVSTHIWAGGERPAYEDGVTFATMQTLAPADTRRMAGRFSIVVVDEAHHAPANVYSRIIAELDPYFLLGLTATPWRGDTRLVEDVFGDPVFNMDIVDGMQQGYLATVDYRMMADDIDWDMVRQWAEHDFSLSDLNRRLFIPTRDEAIVAEIKSSFEELPKAQAIVFTASITHSRRLAGLMAADGITARAIHSGLDRVESTNVLREFRRGTTSALVAVDMLNEGIDVPEVNLVVFARVTHSRRIFIQQLGRGLRLSPGKASVRVLDFVADLRRVAAGMELNRRASEYAKARPEQTVRFPDGRIVQFAETEGVSFLQEYLADLAATIEESGDAVRLRFPSA